MLNNLRGDKLVYNNNSFRYAAYRQFTWWIHNRLGKGVRRVIPSCAIWAIRDLYPDKNAEYIPFREATEEENRLVWQTMLHHWTSFVLTSCFLALCLYLYRKYIAFKLLLDTPFSSQFSWSDPFWPHCKGSLLFLVCCYRKRWTSFQQTDLYDIQYPNSSRCQKIDFLTGLEYQNDKSDNVFSFLWIID